MGKYGGDFLSSRVPGTGKRDMGDLEKEPLAFRKGRPPYDALRGKSRVGTAQGKGFTSYSQIVLELTRGSDYQECLAIARRYAPILGIKVSEFMVIAHRRRR